MILGYTRKVFLALILAIGLTAGVLATGSSAEAMTDKQVFTACKAVADRHYTHHQMKVCKAHPKFAKRTPGVGSGHKQGKRRVSDSKVARWVAAGKVSEPAGGCPGNSVKHGHGYMWVRKGLLGDTIYKWAEVMWYCRADATYGKIRRVLAVKDVVPQAQSGVEVGDIVTKWKSRASDGSSGSAFMERHIDLCVFKYGCYAARYPQGTLTVYALGDWFTWDGKSG